MMSLVFCFGNTYGSFFLQNTNRVPTLLLRMYAKREYDNHAVRDYLIDQSRRMHDDDD